MEVLAVIPARGGSKRIPKKNIVSLAGEPLIYYTIKAAKDSKLVTRVVVSTDDDEINEVSKKLGADVITRPDALCKGELPATVALVHAIETLEKDGFSPELVMELMPTSPLRTSEDIDKAITLFKNHPHGRSLRNPW